MSSLTKNVQGIFAHLRFLAGLLMLLTGLFSTAHAGQLTLSWDASSDPSLGGYKLYYGAASGIYSGNIDVGNQTSYTLAGLTEGQTYYLVATAYNASRSSESGFSNEVSAAVPATSAPVASFTTSATSGAAPMTVTFTSTSTGNITGLAWDLGDGSTASGASVSKYYGAAGTYTVTLAASNAFGSTTASKTITLTAAAVAPVADFTASATTGVAPLTVTFSDATQGGVTAWTWNFGDGGTSSVQNPSHQYMTAGTYNVSLTASGPGGSNQKTKSGYIVVTAPAAPPTTGGGTGSTSIGPVASYNFDETSGTAVKDLSGNGNNGTITGATRIASGRTGYGNALKFNGTSNFVAVPDSATLDLSSRMTIEAWVYPTSAMSNWRSIVAKEDGTSNLAYYLYANTDTNQPITGVRIGNYPMVAGVTQIGAKKWSHLAGTFDGQYLRLYINGALVGMQALTGSIPVSASPLKIGGNKAFGHYFSGYIDDVRVYNRALSDAEIVTDYKTPVAATTSTGSGGSSNVAIQYSTSADRSNPAPLDGATIKGSVYVFTTPDTNVSKVQFWLDNATPTSPTGTATVSESAAPFDFGGTTATGSAYPSDTTQATVGTHTMAVQATLANGTVSPPLVATFTISR